MNWVIKIKMNVMKFGEWKMTDSTIEWTGSGFNRFVIETDTLLETVMVEEAGEYLYKWIVLATEEEWLSEDALYDLNFAFVFVAGASGGDFDYELFDRTLDYQFNTLEEEDENES
jgi:hypothetical protein